ncbi:MAG: alkaline phosphatase family protein [Motilibacteraceae bacterium]
MGEGPAGAPAGSGLVRPRYGEASLAELFPSVLAALGAGDGHQGDHGAAETSNVLGLAPVRAACVLLVDGLGARALAAHPDAAPFLSSLTRRELTTAFPATTVTSSATLGTGTTPGEHGLVGFEMLAPGLDGAPGRVVNGLTWDPDVDPLAFQPVPTVLERAAAAGVRAVHVGPGRFAGSGLTRAAWRGARFVPAATVGQRVAAAASALREPGPALVLAYDGDLDLTGHLSGCGSEAWALQLGHVDRLVEQLVAVLPPDGALWVVADHGMVDVPREARLDLAAEPDLDAGVAALSGEPRARHVHAVPGAAADVLAAWHDRLSDRFLVLSREEATGQGWFGLVVTPAAAARIGDVVALATGDAAVEDSRRMPPAALALVGHHGSLTPQEALVPLIEARPSG